LRCALTPPLLPSSPLRYAIADARRKAVPSWRGRRSCELLLRTGMPPQPPREEPSPLRSLPRRLPGVGEAVRCITLAGDFELRVHEYHCDTCEQTFKPLATLAGCFPVCLTPPAGQVVWIEIRLRRRTARPTQLFQVPNISPAQGEVRVKNAVATRNTVPGARWSVRSQVPYRLCMDARATARSQPRVSWRLEGQRGKQRKANQHNRHQKHQNAQRLRSQISIWANE
jgi:hypothetical protein